MAVVVPGNQIQVRTVVQNDIVKQVKGKGGKPRRLPPQPGTGSASQR